jgi:hypothetical protein
MFARLTVPVLAHAQTVPDSARIRWSGFVDSYIAYDVNRPPTGDRVFTTQAARHAEANVNLAYVDATLDGNRVRGRVALQFGTAVQANYAGEPRRGSISGPEVSRFVQEAFAGYQVTRALWIDGGIMLAPFGPESWVSRDNWTYTRSLVADNSPYYEAGARAVWQMTPAVEAQLHVINGWQNISETNEDKAVAARLQWNVSPNVTLVYDTFIGNEAADTLPSELRLFQEAMVRAALGPRVAAIVAYDWGSQRAMDGRARWRGFVTVVRYEARRRLHVAGRVEAYSDPRQVIVRTGQGKAFVAKGASVNLDVQVDPRLVWRTEMRLLRNKTAVFPERSGPNALTDKNAALVLSLALTL